MTLQEVINHTPSDTVIVISEGSEQDENILFAGGVSMFSMPLLVNRIVLVEQPLEDIVYIKLEG